MPPRRIWLVFLVILGLNYLLMRTMFTGEDEAITVPYTAFKQQVAGGNVEAIYSKGAGIEGRFREAVTWPPPDKQKAAVEAAKKSRLPQFRTTA
jgi:cell division protease FtsH